MTSSTQSLPDIARGDVDVVVVNDLAVDTPERQHAAAETILAVWETRRPWPVALISFNCFLSSSGERVLTYAQWTSDDATREFMRTHRPEGIRALKAAVPGIEASAPVAYRLYRSFVPDGGPRSPSCIVVVSVEATGPQRARQWVDAVLDALRTESGPRPGLISAHFHISTDGTRIINYAEWTDEQAHREAIEDPATEGIAQTDSPEWRRVRTTTGIKPAQRKPGTPSPMYRYYRLYGSLAGPSS